jgi:hypothetical protein
MLRAEIIASVDHLIHAIQSARIDEAIRTNEPASSISAYHAFAREYSAPTRADRHLLEVFELDLLLDPKWWGSALSEEQPTKRTESQNGRPEVHGRIMFAIDKLPKIVSLLRPPAEDNLEPLAQITLLVPENEDQTSPPARVIGAIESIVLIYSAICKMHNEEENTLALRRCDSGSDKSFDFTGLPQVIEQVKSVIFGIIDRVIFFREMKYSERVKCVAESLPVLDQIAQMSKSKKLSPEQAELLRRELIDGATKFLETGSMIPEINNQTRYEPSSLIQASPKLLLEGPGKKATGIRQQSKAPRRKKGSAREKNFTKREIENLVAASHNLSDDERRKLLDLLTKGRTDSPI